MFFLVFYVAEAISLLSLPSAATRCTSRCGAWRLRGPSTSWLWFWQGALFPALAQSPIRYGPAWGANRPLGYNAFRELGVMFVLAPTCFGPYPILYYLDTSIFTEPGLFSSLSVAERQTRRTPCRGGAGGVCRTAGQHPL